MTSSHIHHHVYNRWHFGVSVLLVFMCCMAWIGVMQLDPVRAGARLITERPGSVVSDGVEQWSYTTSGVGNYGLVTSKGTRKDTVKITRTLSYSVDSKSGGVALTFEARPVIRYEIYTKGPNVGEIYKVFKPTCSNVSASARYLYVFRLTPSVRNSVQPLQYDADGSVSFDIVHSVGLKLPRQFPIKRDSLSELLRRQFRIDFEGYTRTYTVYPGLPYGSVSVTKGE